MPSLVFAAPQVGSLNGVPIIEDSASPGVPVIRPGTSGVVGSNAGILATHRPTRVVNDVAAMVALANPLDGHTYKTREYIAGSGVGWNTYTYDADGAVTEDGGFYIDAGPGQFVAVDQSVADVTKFGAVGDDSTDCHAAIQAAFDAGVTAECSAYVPPGLYRISDVLTYKVAIQGAGGASSVGESTQLSSSQFRPTHTGRCIDILHTSDYWQIRDLTINGAFTGGAGIGIRSDGNGTSQATTRYYLGHVKCINFTGSGAYGAVLKGWIGLIENCYFLGSRTGLRLEYAHGVSIVGGELQNNFTGLEVATGEPVSLFGTVIEGNSVTSVSCTAAGSDLNFYGVYFEQTAATAYGIITDADTVLFDGCQFSSNSDVFMELTRVDQVTIRNSNKTTKSNFKLTDCPQISADIPGLVQDDGTDASIGAGFIVNDGNYGQPIVNLVDAPYPLDVSSLGKGWSEVETGDITFTYNTSGSRTLGESSYLILQDTGADPTVRLHLPDQSGLAAGAAGKRLHVGAWVYMPNTTYTSAPYLGIGYKDDGVLQERKVDANTSQLTSWQFVCTFIDVVDDASTLSEFQVVLGGPDTSASAQMHASGIVAWIDGGSSGFAKVMRGDYTQPNLSDTFPSVAAMVAATRLIDGQVYKTTEYVAASGVGGNSYKYDADGAVTEDGGFVIDVTAGGQMVAVDQSVANASQFGVTTADSTAAMAAWSSASASVYDLNGIETIVDDTADEASVVFRNKTDFVVRGNGGKITAKSAMTVGANTNIVFFDNCSRFSVSDLTVDGNRDNRTPAEATAHNIFIQDCKDGRFRGVNSDNACVDGYYLAPDDNTDAATYCERILFDGCSADNCYRQGMSIIDGYEIEVRGGSFTNTNGVSPESGIDIEANAGAVDPSNRRVAINGVLLSGNNGPGALVSSIGPPEDILINNCLFTGNVANVSADTPLACHAENATIHNCRFTGVNQTIDALQKVIITDCVFEDVTGSLSTHGRVVNFLSGFTDHSRLSDCHFTGCTIEIVYVHQSSFAQATISGNFVDSCLRFLYSATRVNVSGNTVDATTGSPVMQLAATADKSIIQGNRVTTGQVIILDLQGPDDIVCSDNIFEAGVSTSQTGVIWHRTSGTSALSNNRIINTTPGSGAAYYTGDGATINANGNTHVGFTGSGLNSSSSGTTSGGLLINYSGAGVPAITANAGSTYRRTDGSAGTVSYTKFSDRDALTWGPVHDAGHTETVTTASPALAVYGSSAIDSSSNAVAATLADGTYIGQRKTVTLTDATNPSTVSVTSHAEASPRVYNLDVAGQTLTFEWNGSKWATTATGDTFPSVTAMVAATGLIDGQVYKTIAYVADSGVGANSYTYDADGVATEDGGFVIDVTAGGQMVAVDRSVADVTKFGAVGDDSTDCYATIQAAFDAAETASVTAELPPGLYRVSATLTYKVPIRGAAGSGSPGETTQLSSTQILPTHNGTCIDIANASDDYWSIQDLILNSRVTTSTGTGITTVNGGGATSASRYMLRNVKIINFSVGAHLIGWIGTIDNCYLLSNAVNNLTLEDAHGVRVVGGEIAGGATGVIITDSSSVAFIGSTIEGHSTRAVYCTSGTSRIVFHACYFEENTGSPFIELDGVDSVSVIDCYVSANGLEAFVFTDVTYVRIAGNGTSSTNFKLSNCGHVVTELGAYENSGQYGATLITSDKELGKPLINMCPNPYADNAGAGWSNVTQTNITYAAAVNSRSRSLGGYIYRLNNATGAGAVARLHLRNQSFLASKMAGKRIYVSGWVYLDNTSYANTPTIGISYKDDAVWVDTGKASISDLVSARENWSFLTAYVDVVDDASTLSDFCVVLGHENLDAARISYFSDLCVWQEAGGHAYSRAMRGEWQTSRFWAPDSNLEATETVTASGPELNISGSSAIDSSSNAVAATLADGTYIGQRKTIRADDVTNAVTVTVANHETSTNEVFTATVVGHYLIVEWMGTVWVTIKTTMAT